LADQTTTLTTAAYTTTFDPLFTVTPSFCANRIDVTATGLDDYVSFDEGTQTISYPQVIDSLVLSGDTQTEYTVTVEVVTIDYDGNETKTPIEYTVTLKNPCIDTDFVNIKIEAPGFVDHDYIINDDPETHSAHGNFYVHTVPVEHSLCGAITLVPSYNNLPMPAGTQPISYNAATQQFISDSDDVDLIGTEVPYAVTGTLTTYPPTTYSTVTVIKGEGDILYNNPCDDPFEFAPTTQTNPPSNKYTNTEVEFSLTQFTIDPPRCKIQYACTGVTGPTNINGLVGITCSDLNFDGVFDSVGDDGKLTYQFDSSVYLDKTVVPGDYTVTITGTATKSGQT
jgi:hypothetical protein